MEIVDANIILRYLLGDLPEFQPLVTDILDRKKFILILDEVIAEVVYVLQGVYKLDRFEISNALQLFLAKDNLICRNPKEISLALKFYSEYKIDFVDSILLAYSTDKNYVIHTFDKKLNNLINNL